jgi:lysozyme
MTAYIQIEMSTRGRHGGLKMKHPALALFMIALTVPVVSCTIAGLIALSAQQPTEPTKITTSSIQQSQLTIKASSEPTKLKLIDISHFINVTNWQAVSNSVDGIYIKATEGTTDTDPKFQTNAAGAMGAKIPTGFYHYFWPGNDTTSAIQQAEYFYNAIKDYDYKLYPVVDVEETNNQNASTICNDVKAFAQEFEILSGLKIMIYSSSNFANKYLTDKSLSQYPLWIAEYNVSAPSVLTAWQNYEAWQYGTAVSVSGIPTPVDADVATNNVFINQSDITKPQGTDSLPVSPVVDKTQ